MTAPKPYSQPGEKGKDTNQASEELREMFRAFVDSVYHACYCPRSVDNGCECAIKDEYIDKVITAIQPLIRNEKLKLLAEVREQQIPVIALKAKKPHDEVQIQAVPIEALTKLEAEL